MARFRVTADGVFDLGERKAPCALGPAGVVPGELKREGDGATPAGVWPIRRLLYRADRSAAPATAIPSAAIARDDGWCDDPRDADYNRPIKLPHAGTFERLWRDDGIYDLVVVLGHNDDPPRPGFGSAIFLHLARPDFSPTQGCVAIARPDLEAFLARVQPGDELEIVGG